MANNTPNTLTIPNQNVKLYAGIIPHEITQFISLIFISILFVYLTPSMIAGFWFIATLLMYARSKNEPLWFAFFMVVSDGFMGFLGIYTATLTLIPGLPAIEASQFYILIALFKALNKRRQFRPFYQGRLNVLGIYALFLVIFGLSNLIGQLNIYFRVIKIVLPLTMFYSVPRLMNNEDDYVRIFSLIFPVTILAFLTQAGNILFGFSPAGLIGAVQEREVDVETGRMYRGFPNPHIVLLSFFGSLFFITQKNKSYNTKYLYLLLAVSSIIAFLSATRGWVLAFGISLFLYIVFVERLKPIRIIGFSVAIFLFVLAGMQISRIQLQMMRSVERIITLKSLAEGDVTMDKTQIRTTQRSPIVMKKWRESPVFGHGFSNVFFDDGDQHVGNQTILLHAGIVGAFLLGSFFINFLLKIINLAFLKPAFKKPLLVFPVFFLCWFIIHSTSGQHFAFYGVPRGIMPQVLYFSFAAIYYSNIKKGLFPSKG
jgi:hypothetical protein